MTKVAIAGLGPRGFYTYAQYQKIHPERMKVAAIADIDEGKLKMAAEDLHVPPEMCFKSAEEMLSREKLADVLIVATQDQQHIGHALAGLERSALTRNAEKAAQLRPLIAQLQQMKEEWAHADHKRN